MTRSLLLSVVLLAAHAQDGGAPMPPDKLLLHADFAGLDNGSPPPDDWWVEGGERVWIEDGHLRTKADPTDPDDPRIVCTVWNKQPLSGDLRVDLDAHVVSSTIAANNINLFLLYADPSGTPLYDTRESRGSAAYALYHKLNGYIFTFLNDREAEGGERARMRFRRCPGFELLTETYSGQCRQGVTYHLTVEKRGGHVTFAVDGKVYLEHTDPQSWNEGLLGLRTFRTDLWWDNIEVTGLGH